MAVSIYLSIITLNVNGLNNQKNGLKKQNPPICCLQETHFRPKDFCRLKVRVWRNICHTNGHRMKAGIAIVTSEKLVFKTKTVTRDKEGHYSIIKGTIQ